jgi:hypothetical protein
MPCKSCGSVDQKKFKVEMAIHFPGAKILISPSCGYFLRLLSASIAATRNLLCRNLNCVNSQEKTPLPQVSDKAI